MAPRREPNLAACGVGSHTALAVYCQIGELKPRTAQPMRQAEKPKPERQIPVTLIRVSVFYLWRLRTWKRTQHERTLRVSCHGVEALLRRLLWRPRKTEQIPVHSSECLFFIYGDSYEESLRRPFFFLQTTQTVAVSLFKVATVAVGILFKKWIISKIGKK